MAQTAMVSAYGQRGSDRKSDPLYVDTDLGTGNGQALEFCLEGCTALVPLEPRQPKIDGFQRTVALARAVAAAYPIRVPDLYRFAVGRWCKVNLVQV